MGEPARVEAMRLLEDAVAQATTAQALLKRLAFFWDKEVGVEAMRVSDDAAATLTKAAKAVKRAEKEAAVAEKASRKAEEYAEREAAKERAEQEAAQKVIDKEAAKAQKARQKIEDERRRTEVRARYEKENAEAEEARQAAEYQQERAAALGRTDDGDEDTKEDAAEGGQEEADDEDPDEASDEAMDEEEVPAIAADAEIPAMAPDKTEMERAKKEVIAEKAARKEAERRDKAAEKESAAAERTRREVEHEERKRQQQERKAAENVEKQRSSSAANLASHRLERRDTNGRRSWMLGQAEEKPSPRGASSIQRLSSTASTCKATFAMSSSDAKKNDTQVEKKKVEKQSTKGGDQADGSAGAAAKLPLSELMGSVKDPSWLPAWRRGAAQTADMEAEVTFAGDCLSIGPDGDTVYCANGTRVGVYSASLGTSMRSLDGHDDTVTCVTTHGDIIASGGKDKVIRLWSAITGVCTTTLVGCDEQINGLELRDDLLMSGEGSAKSGKAHLWSVSSARMTATFADHKGAVWSVAMGGDVGVTASHDMEARVWPLDAEGRTSSRSAFAHPSYVFSVSVHHNVAATGCGDRKVRLWSLSSNVCLRSFEHAGSVGSDAFRDGLFPFCVHLAEGMLVSGGGPDKNVRLWSLARDGECMANFVHGATVRGVAVSSLGFIASAGGKFKRLMIHGPAPA